MPCFGWRTCPVREILNPRLPPAMNRVASAVLWLMSLWVAAGGPVLRASPWEEAERRYAEGAFTLARDGYQRVSTNGLPPADQRWILFRRQDATWRAAVSGPDSASVEQAEQALLALAPEDAPSAARDRVWREVWESLGDLHARRGARDRVAQSYSRALEAWAASTDLETARARFLGLLWKWDQPPHFARGFAGFGAEIPLPWLDSAVAIARQPADVARAHRLRALAAWNSGNAERQRVQVGEDFEAALAGGRADPEYDETLIRYADWLASFGRFRPMPDGGWRREPDSKRALTMYRRLLSEFKQGQTRHWAVAESRVRELTAVAVRLAIPGAYLPGSEIRFDAIWRNVTLIRFRVFPMDLTRDPQFSDPRLSAGAWMQQLRSDGARALQEWTLETHDAGDHQEESREVLMSPRLAPGAYLLEAAAGSVVTREVILVSDLTLVVRSIAGRTLVWAVDAVTGRPQAGASVRFWVHAWSTGGGQGNWSAQDRITGPDGIAEFHHTVPNGAEHWIAARAGARQAVSMGWFGGQPLPDESWKIHAFTDRPVYRPGDPVHWKLLARRLEAGELVTPGGRAVWIGLFDAQGAPLTNSTVTLNAFGSGSGTVATGPAAPLGLYRMQVRDATAAGRVIGEAVLFRLEEYKLPEFEVTVQSPASTNSVKAPGNAVRGFRPGERIPVEIRAAYYFGGPVANAEVEVRIRRRTFQWSPPWDPEVPWLHRDALSEPHGAMRFGKRVSMPGPESGADEELKRETLHTDAAGELSLWVDTDATWGDVELSVEARVVDSSRREVLGRGRVRATRQSYQVAIRPSACTPRPGDVVRVDFRSLDAGGEPVPVAGVMRVAREVWWEVWLDSQGNEVSGAALKRVREQSPVWPPRPAPGMREWRLKSSGYRREELASSPVTLGADGRAETVFRPDREGFYRLSWEGPDRADPKLPEWRPVVRAETLVWVATRAVTDLGYAASGLELIPSVDTVRPGEVLPFLVTGPQADRWVLLTLCTDQLLGHRVVHLTGTTARLEWQMTDAMTPNLWLGASLVHDRALLTDEKELTVPPASHVMSVDIRPDAMESGPRAETGVTIITRDASGRPVSAEVALSVFDESVLQLQTDLAGDLRTLFLDRRHARGLQQSSSFDQRPFLRYLRTRNGTVYEERERLELDAQGNPVPAASPGATPADSSSVESLGLARPAMAMRFGEGGMGRERVLAKRLMARTPLTVDALMSTMDARAEAQSGQDSDGNSAGSSVVVRSDFRATAFWQSEIRTGADGTARVAVRYPESLTRWQAVAQAATVDSLFGREQITTRTVQPLVARLEIPRFLVVGDAAVVSAIVHNHTTNDLRARVQLHAEGVEVAADPDAAGRLLVLAPGGEARGEWTVRAAREGSAVFRLTAAGGAVSDGVQQSLQIHPHGLMQQFVRSGKTTNGEVVVRVALPTRAPGSERLEVRVTPSLALTLLDALPYLADYPYGCTEQTLSRFLPAVVVRQTLKTVGIDAEAAMSRTFGGISTNAAGTVSPSLGSRKNLNQLDAMTRAGLERLVAFQKNDGSWGWWKEGDSDAWMTAYVSWGLKRAARAGVAGVKDEMWRRADAWLMKHLVEAQEDPALQIWMLQALEESTGGPEREVSSRTPELQAALERLWLRRKELSTYSRALLAGVLHQRGDRDRAELVVRSLPDGAVWDSTPDASVILGATGTGGLPSVHWGLDQGWLRWEQGAVETTASVLRALIQVDPSNSMIEPAAHWLLKNRRGMQWSNTRDSALAILALDDFLEVSGELKASLDVSVSLNGRELGRRSVTPESMLAAPMVFHAEGGTLGNSNDVRIVRHAGTAPIYFSVEASCFTQAEPVPAGGNDLFLQREYYRLVPEPTLLRGVEERHELLADGAAIHAGDRLEEVVLVESKRELEYVLLQDLKPAGIEAEALRSGESLWLREVDPKRVASRMKPMPPGRVTDEDEAGRSAWAHPEWRDREVAVFVHRLPAGLWRLRYRFRATTPGDFHALPLSAGAMYVPEIRGNSTEWRVGILDTTRR